MGPVHGQVVCKESALGSKASLSKRSTSRDPNSQPLSLPSRRPGASRQASQAQMAVSPHFGKAEGESEPINLLLAVSGPEETDQGPTRLFISPRVRPHAAGEKAI